MLNKYQFLTIESPRYAIKLAAMGFWVGLLAAGLVILFRFAVEYVQAQFLPGGVSENYEALPLWLIITLPIGGAFLLGIMMQLLPSSMRSVGVVHTFERLAFFGGRMPWINVVVQFVAGGLAIISGHSVGREGPAVHMGAAVGSQIAQSYFLNREQGRTLIAAGVAAAIAASFNTPLAGVIFALEVLMLEYTIAGMVPIIAAAVIATLLSREVFGNEALLHTATTIHAGSAEMLWVALTGIVTGLVAAAFVKCLLFFTSLGTDRPIWLRMTLGGALVAACAVVAPQVMGLGYDTVSASLNQEMAIQLMLLIVALKLLATAGGLGMGIPGGLIGPTIVMGACLGSALGGLGALVWDSLTGMQTLFAMIGMGAMMGATLRAPLAALLAVFELTYDPLLLLPAMLAIVMASMVAGYILRQRSVFRLLLQSRGMDYLEGEISDRLRQVPVTQVMNPWVIAVDAKIARKELKELMSARPAWVVARRRNASPLLIPAVDVARALLVRHDEMLDLVNIPAREQDVVSIDSQRTLQEALYNMQMDKVEAACVYKSENDTQELVGVITMEDVQAFRVNV